MFNRKVLSVVTLILALIVFMPLQAKAEFSIAVVDVHRILSESKAAESIKAQVKTKRDGFVKEVKSVEDDLRKDQKQLEKDRETLSKEDLMKKFRSFEEKRLEARKDLQSRQQKLDESYNKAMAKLSQTISDVCQKIANDNKIDLVITKDNIIVGNKALDITTQVLESLNKTLPSLKLD
tara:strand:- start:722 stop:1258 length:537 start_codon:yes stop_codon:yes gene_type:complete